MSQCGCCKNSGFTQDRFHSMLCSDHFGKYFRVLRMMDHFELSKSHWRATETCCGEAKTVLQDIQRSCSAPCWLRLQFLDAYFHVRLDQKPLLMKLRTLITQKPLWSITSNPAASRVCREGKELIMKCLYTAQATARGVVSLRGPCSPFFFGSVVSI